MRKLVVNGAPVTVTASAQVQGAVGTSGCPAGTPAPDPAHSAALTQGQASPGALPLFQH